MGYGQVAPIVLTVDIVLFRQVSFGHQVLLIQRAKQPYEGLWALPGGKLDTTDSTLEHAALRELWEETGIVVPWLHQVFVFGDVGRDPRGRYVSVLFVGLVSPDTIGRAGDDAALVSWFSLDALPLPLAFDHELLLSTACGSIPFGEMV